MDISWGVDENLPLGSEVVALYGRIITLAGGSKGASEEGGKGESGVELHFDFVRVCENRRF